MSKILHAFLLFSIVILGFCCNLSSTTHDLNRRTVERLNLVNQCHSIAPHNSQSITDILKIRFGTRFTIDQTRIMREALQRHLPSGLGLSVLEVTHNEDILITFWRNPTVGSHVIALYDPSHGLIKVDVMAISSEQQLQAVILHEVGHFLGMHHICWSPLEFDSLGNPILCSPVGYGLAIMNASIDPVAYRFSDLDRLERARVLWCQTHGIL